MDRSTVAETIKDLTSAQLAAQIDILQRQGKGSEKDTIAWVIEMMENRIVELDDSIYATAIKARRRDAADRALAPDIAKAVDQIIR